MQGSFFIGLDRGERQMIEIVKQKRERMFLEEVRIWGTNKERKKR